MNNHRSNLVVALALVMSFFAIPHLIDDFLFDVPAEFGLTVQVTLVLAGIFTVILILSIVLAGRDRKVGYYACLFWGIFLALAGILKHLPRMLLPGSYWSGWFSEFLIYGLVISGITLGVVSIWALRTFRNQD
jgi:hypothetical protein